MKIIVTILFSLTMLMYIASAAGAEGIEPGYATLTFPMVGGYTFDGEQQLETRPVLGIRAGYNFTRNIGFEALFDFVQSVSTKPGSGDVHVFRYGGDFLWHFMPDRKLVPYLAAGYSGITTDYENEAFLAGQAHFHHSSGAFDWGGGVKYFLNDSWALRGDVRQLIVQAGGPLLNYEYSVGLTYQFDWRKLGTLFQPTAESEEALEPEPVVVPSPVAAPAKKTGVAPSAAPAKPEAGGPSAAQQPPGITPAPGIQPETGAAGPSAAQPAPGVAPAPGIQPETGAAPEKEAPLVPLPVAEPGPGRFKYCTTFYVEFDIGSTRIRPEYVKELALLGDFMKQYPTVTAVIEGHTDNVGSYEANMRISRQRAETVVTYLVENFGIERSRLSAEGYGPTRPLADNSTIEGREKNRRIEAIVDCPLGVKEALPAKMPARLCLSLQIQFDTGKVDIKPKYHDEIAQVGDFMRKYPTTTAVIEGHTDNVGGYELNMKLSQRRAESVVDYLVKHFGIERSRLTAKGYGYTRRIAYNNTPEGRQKNRRIDAIIDCVIKQ